MEFSTRTTNTCITGSGIGDLRQDQFVMMNNNSNGNGNEGTTTDGGDGGDVGGGIMASSSTSAHVNVSAVSTSTTTDLNNEFMMILNESGTVHPNDQFMVVDNNEAEASAGPKDQFMIINNNNYEASESVEQNNQFRIIDNNNETSAESTVPNNSQFRIINNNNETSTESAGPNNQFMTINNNNETSAESALPNNQFMIINNQEPGTSDPKDQFMILNNEGNNGIGGGSGESFLVLTDEQNYLTCCNCATSLESPSCFKTNGIYGAVNVKLTNSGDKHATPILDSWVATIPQALKYVLKLDFDPLLESYFAENLLLCYDCNEILTKLYFLRRDFEKLTTKLSFLGRLMKDMYPTADEVVQDQTDISIDNFSINNNKDDKAGGDEASVQKVGGEDNEIIEVKDEPTSDMELDEQDENTSQTSTNHHDVSNALSDQIQNELDNLEQDILLPEENGNNVQQLNTFDNSLRAHDDTKPILPEEHDPDPNSKSKPGKIRVRLTNDQMQSFKSGQRKRPCVSVNKGISVKVVKEERKPASKKYQCSTCRRLFIEVQQNQGKITIVPCPSNGQPVATESSLLEVICEACSKRGLPTPAEKPTAEQPNNKLTKKITNTPDSCIKNESVIDENPLGDQPSNELPKKLNKIPCSGIKSEVGSSETPAEQSDNKLTEKLTNFPLNSDKSQIGIAETVAEQKPGVSHSGNTSPTVITETPAKQINKLTDKLRRVSLGKSKNPIKVRPHLEDCLPCTKNIGGNSSVDSKFYGQQIDLPCQFHKSRSWICEICGKPTHFYDNHRVHILKHIGSEEHEVVEEDDEMVDDDGSLEEPEIILPKLPPESYSCKTCGKSFAVKGALKLHRRKHSQPHRFRCSECGISYRHHWSLLKHVKLHNQRQTFTCSRCFQTFDLRRQLVLHKVYCDELTNPNYQHNMSKSYKEFFSPANVSSHIKNQTPSSDKAKNSPSSSEPKKSHEDKPLIKLSMEGKNPKLIFKSEEAKPTQKLIAGFVKPGPKSKTRKEEPTPELIPDRKSPKLKSPVKKETSNLNLSVEGKHPNSQKAKPKPKLSTERIKLSPAPVVVNSGPKLTSERKKPKLVTRKSPKPKLANPEKLSESETPKLKLTNPRKLSESDTPNLKLTNSKTLRENETLKRKLPMTEKNPKKNLPTQGKLPKLKATTELKPPSSFYCIECAKDNGNSRPLASPVIGPQIDILCPQHKFTQFLCQVCGKRSENTDLHNTHVLSHCGLAERGIVTQALRKPFICLKCGKSFTLRVQLSDHWKSHNIQKSSNPEIKIPQKSSNQEIKIPEKDKNFHCSKCNRSFKNNSGYLRHIKWHESHNQFEFSDVDSI